MAENKKGFMLYADQIHTVEKLSDVKAGKLFKHILQYVNDMNPETDDMIVGIAFEPIKQQLKRDLKRYEAKKTQWSEAGKKSAEAKKASKIQRNSTESTDVEVRSTESTVTVNGTVKDKGTVSRENTGTHEKKIYGLKYFSEMGYTYTQFPSEILTALNDFLVYRSRHPDHGPIKSPDQVEAIAKTIFSRAINPKSFASMVEYTIERGAKNIIYELPENNKTNERKNEQNDTIGRINRERAAEFLTE